MRKYKVTLVAHKVEYVRADDEYDAVDSARDKANRYSTDWEADYDEDGNELIEELDEDGNIIKRGE